MVNESLIRAEYGISSCSLHSECDGCSSCSLELSSVSPGDPRRGSRDPKVMLVTEAPDRSSSSGTAYQGGISGRIISMFTEDKYGIGLGTDSTESFESFLEENRIYATSAIKCYIDGPTQDLGHAVINNCKGEFLTPQIDAMTNLELIIPMGKVACASILSRRLSSLKLTSILGKPGRGVLTEGQRPIPVVAFPHPSGASPLSNPPVLNDADGRETTNRKLQFRTALSAVREEMASIGYDVLGEEPDCWDSPGGLSSFV